MDPITTSLFLPWILPLTAAVAITYVVTKSGKHGIGYFRRKKTYPKLIQWRDKQFHLNQKRYRNEKKNVKVVKRLNIFQKVLKALRIKRYEPRTLGPLERRYNNWRLKKMTDYCTKNNIKFNAQHFMREQKEKQLSDYKERVRTYESPNKYEKHVTYNEYYGEHLDTTTINTSIKKVDEIFGAINSLNMEEFDKPNSNKTHSITVNYNQSLHKKPENISSKNNNAYEWLVGNLLNEIAINASEDSFPVVIEEHFGIDNLDKPTIRTLNRNQLLKLANSFKLEEKVENMKRKLNKNASYNDEQADIEMG